MDKTINYRPTVRACWFGATIMAITVNFTPMLFMPLRDTYGLSYAELGGLTFVNFVTQVTTDLVFSKAADRHGFRRFVVLGQYLCALGFLLFASVPWSFRGAEYAGFLLATVVFSVGAGLQELLLSPIIDATPSDNPERAMSLMHSFYAIGQVVTVVVTTVLMAIFGTRYWPLILCGWALLPIACGTIFLRVPLRQKVSEAEATPIRTLLGSKIFLLSFVSILFAGATELAMSQWTSAFLDRGMNLPKMWGDILGMAGFAVMMGLGRMLHGVCGGKWPLRAVLIAGFAGAAGCYIAAAMTNIPVIAVLACCVTGLCVSLAWPGALSLAAKALPMAGASMFALMAAGGDIGCALGPWLSGLLSDAVVRSTAAAADQAGLRAGLLLGAVFPLGGLMAQLALLKSDTRRGK
ncbi:MAG: MFS transporter [Clostridiaceae bacterium]|nr:MFS transporter [Clostridiaceae bacterium]